MHASFAYSHSANGLHRRSRSRAGFSLLEAVVALFVLTVGVGAMFLTNLQVLKVLGRAKETVAARQILQGRMDRIRAVTFKELTNPTFVSGTLLAPGATGDPIGSNSTMMLRGLRETVTIHALGERLFPDATARSAATPLRVGETASEISNTAPSSPTAYAATAITPGSWAATAALPKMEMRRNGSGGAATVTVLSNNNLWAYPQVRVDLQVTWLDAGGRTRNQMSSAVVAKQTLPP